MIKGILILLLVAVILCVAKSIVKCPDFVSGVNNWYPQCVQGYLTLLPK